MPEQPYDDDHPDVIRAKAEAEKLLIEARAKMHPVAQAIHTLFESLTNLVGCLGCLFIILVIILAILAPTVLTGFSAR